MSIDTYPPQSTQATVTRTDTMTIQGGTGGAGIFSPGVWPATGQTSMRAFWCVPESYAGGDVTFRWLRRTNSTGGTAVFTYLLSRARAGSVGVTLIALTGANLTPGDTTAQVLSVVGAASNFQAGDVLRFELIRDGDNAGDTFAADVISDGLSVTYNAYVMGYAAYPASVNNATYEEGTFTVTGTGFSGTAPSGTVTYTRIGRVVTLAFVNINGTSNATTFTLTGVPAALGVTTPTHGSTVWLQDNAVPVVGRMQPPNTSGVIGIQRDPFPNPFTASGTKMLYPCSFTYQIF